MAQVLKAGSVVLPSPTKISVSDELIWSANTGRSPDSGKMLGDVLGNKKTVDIEWGVLKESDVKKIQDALTAGFFSFSLHDCGEVAIKVYRSTIKKEHLGDIGDGNYYYRSVTVSVIEQ